MRIKQVFWGLLLPSVTLATSNVTVVPLASDCSVYPAYNDATGSAGPFTVVADSTGTTIDGNEISIETFTSNGIDHYGFITLPKYAGTMPNVSLSCTPSSIWANSSVGTVALEVAPEENWQASFSFNTSPGQPGIEVEPYAHYVNGTRQPGVFLGAKNTTTWTYKYNWGGNAGEYYLLRLLGVLNVKATRTSEKRQVFTPPPLTFPPNDTDYTGFLKVVPL